MSEPQRRLLPDDPAEQPIDTARTSDQPEAGAPVTHAASEAPLTEQGAAPAAAASAKPDDEQMAAQPGDESAAESVPESVARPVRVGLREGREARGWSLEEAARRLRLSVAQVEAIERRDWASLPAQAYCQGFIKNYARLVDLDPSDDLQALGEHYRQLRPSDLLRDDPTTLARYDEAGALRNTTSANPVLIGGAVLLAVLAIGVGVFGDRIIRMTGLSGWMAKSETIVLPPKAAVENVPLTVVQPPPASAAPDTAAVVTASVPPAAGAPSAAPPAAAPASPLTAAPAVPPAAPDAASPAPVQSAAVPGERRIRLVYRADAWVEVRDGSGAILASPLNRAGSEQVLSGKPPLRLVIGSAAGVSLEADGKPIDLTPYKQANVARMTLN